MKVSHTSKEITTRSQFNANNRDVSDNPIFFILFQNGVWNMLKNACFVRIALYKTKFIFYNLRNFDVPWIWI